MSKAGTTTVGGTPALKLIDTDGKDEVRLYVATKGRPYLLKVDQVSDGKSEKALIFSDYDKPVKAEPPSGEVLDLDKPTGLTRCSRPPAEQALARMPAVAWTSTLRSGAESLSRGPGISKTRPVAIWRKRRARAERLKQEARLVYRQGVISAFEEKVRHPVDQRPSALLEVLEGAPLPPEDLDPLREAVPELISVRRHDVQQVSTAGHTVTMIVVTLAAVPFIQAVVASLGNAVGEGIQRGSRRAVQRLFSQRRQAALTAVPHSPRTTVIFRLVREGTDIKVQLPHGEEDEATAAAVLPQLDFEAFGESKTIVYWFDGTWMAAAALPHQRPVSVRWNLEDGQWEPLYPGADLLQPPSSNDDDADPVD